MHLEWWKKYQIGTFNNIVISKDFLNTKIVLHAIISTKCSLKHSQEANFTDIGSSSLFFFTPFTWKSELVLPQLAARNNLINSRARTWLRLLLRPFSVSCLNRHRRVAGGVGRSVAQLSAQVSNWSRPRAKATGPARVRKTNGFKIRRRRSFNPSLLACSLFCEGNGLK